MTQSEPAIETLASGLERAQIEALLRDAEPQRMAAMAASINLAFGGGLTVLAQALSDGSFVWMIVAAIGAGTIWQISNRLWRDVAIASVAPVLGVRWGQSEFVSGWRSVELEQLIGDLFSSDGARFTAWQSRGKYRDIAYALSETTTWRRRHQNQRREISHAMHVDISVPQGFSGSVELIPTAGFMGKVDAVFRQVTGALEQRRDVDPEFDVVFDTMVSAGASVDTLLTPDFRRAMLALAARHQRIYLSARFEHGWFRLRLPIKHLAFSAARLRTPMVDMVDDVDALWWDLTIAHRLIDGLMGDHDGPLR